MVDKFMELMKMPLNIGNAVIEGGQVGLNGGNPLLATAQKLEAALVKPFGMFAPPMAKGGQLPGLPSSLTQLPAFPSQLAAPLQQLTALPLPIGSEYVGQKQDISKAKNVQTTIF